MSGDDNAARIAGRMSLTDRWRAIRQVIRHVPLFGGWREQVEGIPIGGVGGRPVFLPIEGHSLTIGATGEGKFTSVIAPMALHDVRDENGLAAGMVFVDPKNGEAARYTAPYRDHVREEMVFVIDPFGKAGGTDTLNPFEFIDALGDDFYEQCSALAEALIVQRPKEKRGNDFIWDSRGKEWTRAMIGYLAMAPEEERTIMRLRQIFSSGTDAFEAVLAAMEALPAAPAFILNSATDMRRVTSKAEREASGYLATILEATQFADSSLVSRTLRASSFDPMVVRSHGATVYIVTDDQKLESCAPWVRLICECILQRVLRSPVKRQVHFVIDEARAFDAWRFIETGLRALRGANISLHLFYQNIGQLKSVWGEGWSSMTDVKLTRFLGSGDVDTLKWIAELCGETTIVEYGRSEAHNTTTGTSTALGASKTTAHAFGQSDGENWSKGDSHAEGRSISGARSRSDTWSQQSSKSKTRTKTESSGTAFGTSSSLTNGWSSQQSYSFGDSGGGSVTIGGTPGGASSYTMQSGSSEQYSFSYGKSGSKTFGESFTTNTSHGSSVGTTDGTSGSKGASLGRTLTAGRNVTDSNTRSRGGNRGTTETVTGSNGKSVTVTDNESETDGITRTFTERHRLLTVDEVRRMDESQMLVFVGRKPDCLVERLHYHKCAPLMERVLRGHVAKAERLAAPS